MAKEELLEFDGTVTEVLPDGNYRVTLDNEHQVAGLHVGKMRKFRIRTGVGDRVIVEVSPYDLSRGRIISATRAIARPQRHRRADPIFAALSRLGTIQVLHAIGRRDLKPGDRHDYVRSTRSSVDPKLLEILVCPLTKGPLEYDPTSRS